VEGLFYTAPDTDPSKPESDLCGLLFETTSHTSTEKVQRSASHINPLPPNSHCLYISSVDAVDMPRMSSEHFFPYISQSLLNFEPASQITDFPEAWHYHRLNLQATTYPILPIAPKKYTRPDFVQREVVSQQKPVYLQPYAAPVAKDLTTLDAVTKAAAIAVQYASRICNKLPPTSSSVSSKDRYDDMFSPSEICDSYARSKQIYSGNHSAFSVLPDLRDLPLKVSSAYTGFQSFPSAPSELDCFGNAQWRIPAHTSPHLCDAALLPSTQYTIDDHNQIDCESWFLS
jgi:hypothetical protein